LQTAILGSDLFSCLASLDALTYEFVFSFYLSFLIYLVFSLILFT